MTPRLELKICDGWRNKKFYFLIYNEILNQSLFFLADIYSAYDCARVLVNSKLETTARFCKLLCFRYGIHDIFPNLTKTISAYKLLIKNIISLKLTEVSMN